MKSFVILLLFAFVCNFSDCFSDNSDLIAVVQVFRHGQRTPIYFYPNDPYANISYWPVEPGQLTNEGKRQLYNLGKYTRQRYNDFLSSTYNYKDFYAQTTDVDRTHMSAQAFLAGLYTPNPEQQWNPDLKWQPIPVHPMDRKMFAAGAGCPNFQDNLADVLLNDDFYVALNENYSDIYNLISENARTQVIEVAQAADIYDMLHIEDIFGYKLPQWTDSVYPQPLRRMAGYRSQALGYNDQLKRLGIGFWLHIIAEYFDEIVKDPASNRKYQVFSGHDNNIATILSCFGIIKEDPPAFASTIYLELRNATGGGVLINVWHRDGDSDIEGLTIKGCQFDCKLDDFKDIIKAWNVDEDTWTRECSATTEKIFTDEMKRTKLWLQEDYKKRNPVFGFQ